MTNLYQRIAEDCPSIKRGKVWCIACKRMQFVDGAGALAHGWPKCCGATMTIDSPQWRAAHAKKRAAPPAPQASGALTP